MKLSHGFGLLATGLGTVGLMVFASVTGCSSSSGGSDGGTSGGASDLCSNLPASACNPEPSAPSGASKTSVTASHNYALHHLYLGDTDRMGNQSMTAWSTYGYNLDGKVTTASSTDVCTLQPGAQKSYQVDGTGGIDNSFGENIIPILQTLIATPTPTINTTIANGSFTLFTYVTGFDDSAGNKTSATGLTGVLLAGAKFSEDGGTPPMVWPTSLDWPALPDPGLIMGCSATTGCPAGTDPVANAVIKFDSAFQSNGTFVNGSPSTVSLSLSIGGQTLTLPVASAVITFDPEAPGSVTNGTIAGVLDTNTLISSLMNVAGHFSPTLCGGSAFQSIAMQIEATSDIILNGSTVSNTAGTQCNAISVGLGFDSSEIAKPDTIAPPAPPSANPCSDAGSAGD